MIKPPLPERVMGQLILHVSSRKSPAPPIVMGFAVPAPISEFIILINEPPVLNTPPSSVLACPQLSNESCPVQLGRLRPYPLVTIKKEFSIKMDPAPAAAEENKSVALTNTTPSTVKLLIADGV